MRLPTRVRYGIRAMVELAKQPEHKPISLRELGQNQGISAKYLQQMAAALKIGGLIDSVRGAEGGYRLTRPAEQITAWDICRVLGIPPDPVECVNTNTCPRQSCCVAHELWADMADAIGTALKSRNLAQLAQREIELEKQATNPAQGR